MGKRRDIQIADMVGNPIGEKIQRLEDSVRKDGELTRTEYTKQIKDLKDVVDVVIDDLSIREKKEIYDLNTLTDIATLDETERRFLVEVLYTLANMSEHTEESQKAFISAIQRYLGITNVQTSVNLEMIESIDNISIQKALLQPVMEFLYLGNLDHSYLVEYEDILSYFSVNKKGKLEIQTAIDNICNAIGVSGLYEKYGFSSGALPEDVKNKINDIISINKIGKYIPNEDYFEDFFDIRYKSKNEYCKNIKNDLQNRVPTFFSKKNPINYSIRLYEENLSAIVRGIANRFELQESEFLGIISEYQSNVSEYKNLSEYLNVEFNGVTDEPQLVKVRHVSGQVYLNLKEEKLYVINNYQKSRVANAFIKVFNETLDRLYEIYEESLDRIIKRVLSLKFVIEDKNYDINDIDDASQLYDIGMLYLNGIGMDASKNEALKFFCKSALLANEKAENTIKENFVKDGNIISILENSVLFKTHEIDNTVFPFSIFQKIMLLKTDGELVELKRFSPSSTVPENFWGNTHSYLNGVIFDIIDNGELFVMKYDQNTYALSLVDSWKISESMDFNAFLHSEFRVNAESVIYNIKNLLKNNEIIFEKIY